MCSNTHPPTRAQTHTHTHTHGCQDCMYACAYVQTWHTCRHSSFHPIHRRTRTRLARIHLRAHAHVYVHANKQTRTHGTCRYNSFHPNIVTFYGADIYPERSSIVLATEFMHLYSLKDISAQCGLSSPSPTHLAMIYVVREHILQ